MEEDCEIWNAWAKTLQRWGIAGWIAELLEAAGPFSLLVAQTVYLAQPLLGKPFPDGRLQALARILEDPQRAQIFARVLRGKPVV